MSDMTKCATSGLLVPEGYCAGRVEGDCIHATRAREHMKTMVELHRQEGLPPPIMGGARCGCVTPEVLGCLCAGQSSDSIELTGTASADSPWTWDVILNPASNNALSISAAGLFAPLSASLVDLEVFTSTGNFIKGNFPGIQRVLIVVQASGGGGGGAQGTGSGQGSGGAGGAGGGAVERLLAEGALATSETVTIGAGGTGGGGPSSGNIGAASSFGAHAIANPGGGGSGGVSPGSVTAISQGGVGGGGTGGVVTNGGDGRPVYKATVQNTLPGDGGGSRFGGGTRAATGSNSNGVNGRDNTGEGGSGARNGASQSQTTGGTGGSGIGLVYVYR